MKNHSPQHLKAEIDNPTPPTAAQVLGSALHTLVLEPDLFFDLYDMAGQCAADTKSGTRCSNIGSRRRDGEWFCGVRGHDPRPDDAPDPIAVLDAEQSAAIRAMREAVMAHELAGGIIERATDRELSAFWTDPATGIQCKARWDAPDTEAGVIADLKSCDDASPSGFRRSIGKWGYHRQNAFYMAGADVLAPASFGAFLFIAVEKKRPHGVAIYRLPDVAVDAGAEELKPLMEQYAKCTASGEWPGYADAVTDLDIPAWVYHELNY